MFPLEVLPLKGVLASLVPQMIGLAFLLVYTAVATGGLPDTYVLLPVALAIQIIGCFGNPRARYPELLNLVASGRLQPGRVVTRELALDDIQSVFDALDRFDTVGFNVITSF